PANILLVSGGVVSAKLVSSEPSSTGATPHHSPLTTHQPKITDFGLAKRLEEQGQTRSGDVLGTPHYMAPEQAAGRVSQIGPTTDIHALGAILYELLTGGPPFGKPTLLDTLAQVREQDPTSLRTLRQEVPRDLEVICQKCMRKEPRQRYASALELADDLRRFLDGESIKARPMRTWEKAVRWVRRHPSWTILGALTLILVPLVVILALRLRGPRLRDYSEGEIHTAAARVRGDLFALLRDARTPKGWVRCDLRDPENPDVEAWSQGQTLFVLLSCPDASPAELSDFASNLELLFTDAERITRKGIRYGWMPHIDSTHTQSEPALWTAAALAVALRHPGLLTGERRKRFEGYLDETHAILRTYAPTTAKDGWQQLPNPENPACQNTYTNALALLTLLETRRAGLGWEGKTQRRDELLAQTAAWLVRYFDTDAEVPGWNKDSMSHEKVIDGLTLQIYSLLLRADIEAGVRLPAAIREKIPDHLMRCARRDLDYPDTSAYTSYPFRNHEGKVIPGKQNLTFLWYPWAVEACVRWLEYAHQHGEPANKTNPVRNVLGYLVVDLGPELTTRGISFVFIPTERLWALCSVP
ncbi:MAG TPA: serine/threonine-protein kinase, partial [Gemmataceae bacterium]|nr:serine/threonine-protein kinase [Gemmataceae bacterium]